MKNTLLQKIIIETVCCLYVLLFTYAAVSKFLDFENFVVQLGTSPMLSAYANWVAWIVPTVEIILSLLLLIKKSRFIALFLSYILMCFFTAYIYIILNYSAFIPCSCGGILEKMGWTEHLLFNIAFIALAILGLLLHEPIIRLGTNKKALSLAIALSFFISVAFMFGVFKSSENIMQHHNSFVRRFPHGPIQIQEYDLKYNSFYIAGIDEENIYLGNTTAPLLVTILDSTFQRKTERHIDLEQNTFGFRSVNLRVKSPDFIFTDGSVPVIFSGKTIDWKAKIAWKGTQYFTHPEIIDSLNVLFRMDDANRENTIGSLYFGKEPKLRVGHGILKKQADGDFDIEGTVRFDFNSQKIIYCYRYRNQYLIANRGLDLQSSGKTIDTISKAKIKIAYVASHGQKKMAAPPLVVNKSIAVDGNRLFVHSLLKGKYERDNVWNDVSAIDVYDLTTKAYLSSFYIYDIDHSKLRGYTVKGNSFYGLVGEHLVKYSLGQAFDARLQ